MTTLTAEHSSRVVLAEQACSPDGFYLGEPEDVHEPVPLDEQELPAEQRHEQLPGPQRIPACAADLSIAFNQLLWHRICGTGNGSSACLAMSSCSQMIESGAS